MSLSLLASLKSSVTRFLENRDGQVGAVFAVTILPILALTGSGVELSMINANRGGLQNALDAAALSVVRDGAATEDEAETMIAERMSALLGRSGITVDVSEFTPSAHLVATANETYETVLLDVMGLTDFDLGVDTEVTTGGNRPVEVVLVLDNTPSMYGNGGIEALKRAVDEFLDVMEEAGVDEDNLRLGLVPFTISVNIRGEGFSWDWMDRAGRAEWHGNQFDETAGPVNIFDLYDAIPNAEWAGCVEYRGREYYRTDTAPVSADPDSLFVPFMIPDDPDFWDDDRTLRGARRYDYPRAQYLPDDLPPFDPRHPYHEQDLTQIRSTGKYDGTPMNPQSAIFTRGPNSGCSEQAVIPLQGSIDHIRRAVRDFRNPQGYGTDHLMGLMWGWRVLSPGAPYTEGAPYNDGETRKILIMMTDGELVVGGTSAHLRTPQRSYYTGFGYAYEARRSVGDVPALNNIVRRDMAVACESMHDLGIEIFAVTYSMNDRRTLDTLADCASGDDHFISTRGHIDLREAFASIARSIQADNLRLAR